MEDHEAMMSILDQNEVSNMDQLFEKFQGDE